MPNKTQLIDKVNPVTQVLCIFIYGTPLLISIDIVSSAIALVLVILINLLVVCGVKEMLVKSSVLLFLAPMFSLSLLLYAKPKGNIYFSYGPMTISTGSIVLAIAMLLRILALGIPAVVIFTRIDPTLMADGLTQILKLPARPVIASLSAVRMMHLMAHDMKYLGYARRTRSIRSRGIRGMFSSAFALMFFALRRAAKLATTMEARGFGCTDTKRTFARPSRMGRWDTLALVIAVLIPVISIAVAALYGTFRPFGV